MFSSLFLFFYCCSLPWNHFYFICNPTPHTKTMNQGNLQTEVKESIAFAVENTWVKLIGLNTFYVTSFSSILYWSNSEYWSQKQTQSGIIHSIQQRTEIGALVVLFIPIHQFSYIYIQALRVTECCTYYMSQVAHNITCFTLICRYRSTGRLLTILLFNGGSYFRRSDIIVIRWSSITNMNKQSGACFGSHRPQIEPNERRNILLKYPPPPAFEPRTLRS